MSQNPISQGQPSPEQGLACLPFRLRVASVDAHRPTWCTGDILSGTVTLGNLVRSQPHGNEVLEVLEIVVGATQQTQAEAGATVALRLSGNGPLHPGQLLASNLEPAREADQLSGTMVWNGPDPLLSGRTYRLRVGPLALAVTVTAIGDPQAPEEPGVPATQGLKPGQVALVGLSAEQPIAFDAFAENPATGRLQICGTDDAGVCGIYEIGSQPQHPRSIVFQRLDVNQAARASRLRQKPCVIWFTGLSGAGKSTIANLVERRLHDLGHHTYLLDGDNVRHGLNKDPGFSDADRVENIRRVAEVARLMVDAGLIALVSFISPFRSERRMARALLQPDEFIEVYVDTPLSVAEARDPKGLYRKARRGELKNFTGLDSPYEPPERPEVRIQTIEGEAQLAADCVVDYLRAHRFLRTPID